MALNDIPPMAAKGSFSFGLFVVSVVQAVRLSPQFWLCPPLRDLHLRHWFFGFLQSLVRCPFSQQLKHLGLPLLWVVSMVTSRLDHSGLSKVFPWRSSKALICLLTAQIAMSIGSTAALLLLCQNTSSMSCLETFYSNRYTPNVLSIFDWKYNILHFAR